MSRQRTETQIIVQAMAALQLEIRALTMAIKAPEDVLTEVHKFHVQAKTLMQSAEADADVLAIKGEVLQRKGPPSGEDRPGAYDSPVMRVIDGRE